MNFQIQKLWDNANFALEQMCYNSTVRLGKEGVLQVIGQDNAIKLPSGLNIFYEDLKYTRNEDTGRDELTYKVRRGRNKIYGGKVIENVCQAIARCIIGEQLLNIAKKYKVVLTVHDSIVCCVKENEAEAAQKYIETCMRTAPEWAHGLPIDCESGIGKSYGECE